MNNLKIAFFGTDQFSVFVLEELLRAKIKPDLIISTPDTYQGRKMKLTPTEVKVWAEENNVPVIQPNSLKTIPEDLRKKEKEKEWDLFLVASYGKIIPEEIFELPKYKTLNVHPSLLPLYRGPSPIESAMLDDALNTGVTIMKIGKGLDDGPILNQEIVSFEEWERKPVISEKLARIGGQLLVRTIPLWINNNIEEQEQDDKLATHTKKIEKTEAELDLNEPDRKNFLKIMAYYPWPNAFFFDKNRKRIKVTDAKFNKDTEELEILKVIPEGKKEQDYKD
jgi:methionyl-tRNA formyltransferase